MKELIIGENDKGQRLDRFLGKAVPALPSSLMHKYVRLKRIKVNGARAAENLHLELGDVVTLYINDEFFTPAKKETKDSFKTAGRELDIVYEDDNIMLINKPAGLLCHSGEGYERDTLIFRIQGYLYHKGVWDPEKENAFAPALCNRIDRNTSGIVIAAKTAEALAIMNEKIKTREIDKRYLCIVHGRPNPVSAKLEGYIFKDESKAQVFVRRTPTPGAKRAVTVYKVLATENDLSLVECELVTGRTHQIRAQMANAGYPLLGDGKYGRNRLNTEYGETKQALCSYRLRFDFKSPAGSLDYLNGRSFQVKNIAFVDKYFPKFRKK